MHIFVYMKSEYKNIRIKICFHTKVSTKNAVENLLSVIQHYRECSEKDN